jgi:hypothetical protein
MNDGTDNGGGDCEWADRRKGVFWGRLDTVVKRVSKGGERASKRGCAGATER